MTKKGRNKVTINANSNEYRPSYLEKCSSGNKKTECD